LSFSLQASADTWDGRFTGQLASNTGEVCEADFVFTRYDSYLDFEISRLECASAILTSDFPKLHMQQEGRLLLAIEPNTTEICGSINPDTLECRRDTSLDGFSIEFHKISEDSFQVFYLGNRSINLNGVLKKIISN